MERRLKSFHEFTKTNENLEFEESAPAAAPATPAPAETPAAEAPKDETLDFGEGEATQSDSAEPKPSETGDDKEVKNKELVAKLNNMIGVLNSHRSFLKNEDADENLVKKVNSLFAEFNKY